MNRGFILLPCTVLGLPPPNERRGMVIAVTMGFEHTVIVMQNGDVYGCGQNSYGCLGDPDITNGINVYIPKKIVSGIIGEKKIKVKNAFSGEHHTWFIDENDRAWGCGENTYGDLGVGTRDSVKGIQKVKLDVRIKFIEGGTRASLFLDYNGIVYGSGAMSSGSSLTSNTIPTKILFNFGDSKFKWKMISSGCDRQLFLNTNNEIYALDYKVPKFPKKIRDLSSYKNVYVNAGYNYFFWCYLNGNKTIGYYDKSNDVKSLRKNAMKGKWKEFQKVNIIENVEQIVCGSYQIILLCKSGKIYVGGHNVNGSFGLGHKKELKDVIVHTILDCNMINLVNSDSEILRFMQKMMGNQKYIDVCIKLT